MATPTAVPDWVEAYAQEALAAPVTLDNALKYRWYQIGVGIRAQHPMVYDGDIAPAVQRLQRHGSSVVEELKHQLDARFAVVPSLEAAGPAPARCSWIMARDRGEGATQLQIVLDRHCREHAAPALYARLVQERADRLDVHLSTLPHLDVAYPDRLVGTPGYVGREDVAGGYARALDRRLAAAEPIVIDEITRVFAAKAMGDGPLEPATRQCRDLLGRWYPHGDALRAFAEGDPLGGNDAASAPQRFTRAIGEACTREARAWLLRQRPTIEAKVHSAIAAVDPARDPIVSVDTRCTGVLAAWFPRYDVFDAALIGQLRNTCRREADELNRSALTQAAASIAGRFERVPRTLDGLERNRWFEPRASDIQGATDPGDTSRIEVEAALRAEVAARVRPWRDAATEAALREISTVYASADTTGDGASAARGRCSPYLGDPVRSLPPGGGDIRTALTAACRDQDQRLTGRRVTAALAAAHAIEVLGPGRLLIGTPEGRPVYLDPRAIVAAAAVNRLQVSFIQSTSWTLQSRTILRITPMGGNAPALLGTLHPETRPDGVPVWRVTALDALPGLDGPLATLSCVAMGQEAALASVLKVGAGVLVAMGVDAPVTAGALLDDGLTGLITVEGCDTARRTFLESRAR